MKYEKRAFSFNLSAFSFGSPLLEDEVSTMTALSPGDDDGPEEEDDDWSDIDDEDFEDMAEDEDDVHEMEVENDIFDDEDDDHLPDDDF